jgi:hypothetical protein
VAKSGGIAFNIPKEQLVEIQRAAEAQIEKPAEVPVEKPAEKPVAVVEQFDLVEEVTLDEGRGFEKKKPGALEHARPGTREIGVA